MKKIFFVTSSLGSGGAERVMTTLANNFTGIGYKVTIFSKYNITPFYELSKGVNILYPKYSINNSTPFSLLITRFKAYLDIYSFLRNENPDIVIPFSTYTNGIIIIICKILSLKVIASEHNNYKLNLNSISNWFIKRVIYPYADCITVLTYRDKEQYYDRFMKNVVVMPNPLSIKQVNQFQDFKREKIILAIGNLSRWSQKGFDNLLKIYKQTCLKHPDWKLHIAGGGDSKYISELIRNLRLEDKVTLLGEVRNIQYLMQRNSIFVLTSRYEGLPMVLLEAMSQGMACVAFDCFTGPRDIISNKVDGSLVEDQNIDAFVCELSKIIENQNLRIEMGINAFETSKKYLPEQIVEKWRILIDQTIK